MEGERHHLIEPSGERACAAANSEHSRFTVLKSVSQDAMIRTNSLNAHARCLVKSRARA